MGTASHHSSGVALVSRPCVNGQKSWGEAVRLLLSLMAEHGCWCVCHSSESEKSMQGRKEPAHERGPGPDRRRPSRLSLRLASTLISRADYFFVMISRPRRRNDRIGDLAGA